MVVLARPLAPAAYVQDVAPTLLPVPTATETDVIVRGFSANARIHPRARPTSWHVEYGATASYGSSTTPRALPGRNAAHYKETWTTDSTTSGWMASINRNGLTWQSGGYVRYTSQSGGDDDPNHVSGVGYVHLVCIGYVGSYDPTDLPMICLGGGHPDLRGARIKLRLRAQSYTQHGAQLMSWIQVDEDTTKENPGPDRRPNWANTGAVVTLGPNDGSWVWREWTLRNSTHEWTYAGRNDTHPEHRYWYGELDKTLRNVNVDFFPLMAVDVNLNLEPSGAIDIDDLEITYRQHSVCAESNGGRLVSAPAGGTGTEYLTDGWRNEAAGGEGDWLSAENPSAPQEFVFAFADPVTIDTVQIHNSAAYPSEDVEVAVSEDDGETWTVLGTYTLPESSTFGPNFLFHREYATDVDTTFIPLHAEPVTRMRVRIMSGYQSTRWGLGEIEAFGTGATETTDDDWYDVNQDVELAAGTYHFRVAATNAEGTVYGPDQTVTVV